MLQPELLEDRCQPNAAPWAGPAAPPARHELILVESDVAERSVLEQGLLASVPAGTTAEIVELCGGGSEEIAAVLRTRSGLDAIHLFSHGAAGELDLGSAELTAANLAAHADDLAVWGSALRPGGALLLYGCNVAAGPSGADFLRRLHELTGTALAASTDLTGAAALGGNYVLERTVGAVREAALSAAAWSGTLQNYLVTNANDSGVNSLRWAIQQANANAGNDQINFAIAGSGIRTITVQSALPTVSDRVRIDGWTQGGGGYQGPPLVELVGPTFLGLPTVGAGLRLAGNGSSQSMIRGLAIGRFWDGIQIVDSNNNLVEGNYVGTDAAGAAARGNLFNGIYLGGASSGNQIGGNGTGRRNVVAGNAGEGVKLDGPGVVGTTVVGNYIGLAANGSSALGNGRHGVWIQDSPGNQIGGKAAGDGNVISANGAAGIGIAGSNAVGNAVQGNIVGADAAGLLNRGNAGDGVQFLAHNDFFFPTAIGYGSGNRIGGVNAGEGNVVAFNRGAGIALPLDGSPTPYATGNSLRGNALFGNGGLGIDLGASGTTPNTLGGPHVGPNNLQNYPILTSASANGPNLSVAFALNAAPNQLFSIDFYASPSADPSGYGEGKVFVGTATALTDPSGNVAFSLGLTLPAGAGAWISATATDAAGNTSEFSGALRAAVPVSTVTSAPQGADNTVTMLENVSYTFGAGDFGFSDPNDTPANALLAVKIAALPTAGTLWLNGVALTAPATVSASQLAAGMLVFTPATNANGLAYASFTFQVQDDGGTANGGVDLDPIPRTITLNVTPVNQPPNGTNRSVTLLENGSYTFGAGDFGFGDPNDIPANALLAVKIAALPTAGTLWLNGVALTAPATVSASQLAAGMLVFTPAANASGLAYASFTFQVQDDGGTANGGLDLDPTPRTITLNVTPVNQPPNGTNRSVTLLENGSYTFGAGDFGFSDPNDIPANALLAVKITALPTAGTLWLNGVALTAPATVSASQLAAGMLVFTPAANASGLAYASFTFQVQDDGGTANGGLDLDPTPRTITLNVTPVNQPPNGTNRSVTLLENGSYTFGAGDFGFSDPNDTPANALLAVKITALPTAGTLWLNGVGISAGKFVSATDLANGRLVFTPAANASGLAYASFTFQVQDDGGTANGGLDLDPTPRTITLNVAPVNQPPNGMNRSVTLLENGSYTFGAGDFGFSDPNDTPANALLAVKITALPTAGTLWLNGVALTAPATVSASQLAAGMLVFTPAANASGLAYASFTFQVQDDGGTANGGVDLDPTPRTITLNVTPVNQPPQSAPTATNSTFTVAFNTPLYAGPAGVLAGAVDPQGLPLTAVLVTPPRFGTLTLNADGSFAYLPNLNFSGADAFTFRASNGIQFSSAAMAALQVQRPATVPVTPPAIPAPPPATVTDAPAPTPLPTPGSGPPARPALPATEPVSLPITLLAPGSSGRPTGTSAPAAAPAPVDASAPPSSRAANLQLATFVSAPLPAPVPAPLPPVAADARAAESAPAASRLRLMEDHPIFAGLDQAAKDLQAESEGAAELQLAAGAGAGLAAGYVLLNTRAVFWFLGALFARSAVWKRLDPLDVIYAWEAEQQRGRRGDGESLGTMVR